MPKKLITIVITLLLVTACSENNKMMKKAIFLHHSTGYTVWLGKTNNLLYKVRNKGDVQKHVEEYNRNNGTNYQIQERFFPKQAPYGWNNYPYDYYNIWVKNAGTEPYMEEATLEMLTAEYDLIIFKHCYPVSSIQPDSGSPDINSPIKSIENYKLQYAALKQKMYEFPNTKFIVWTPAVHTRSQITEEEALRTREFRDWIINEWDKKGDNIYIWDFYGYETEGGLYLTQQNAVSPDNSHPNVDFAARLSPLFGQFIIDVFESKVE